MWAVGDTVGDSSPRRGIHAARALGSTALRSSTALGGDRLQARPPRPGSPFAECSRPFTLEAGGAATVEVRLAGVPRGLRAKAEHKAEHKAKRAHHGHGKAPEESPDASDASAAKPVTDVIADAAAKIEEHGDANIAHHAKELEAHSEANAEALSHSNPHEEGSLADDIHKHKEKRRIEELARAGVADGAVDAYDDDDDDEPAAASAADDERPAASEEKVEKVVAPDGDATAPVDLSRGWKDQRVAAGVDAEENFSDRGGETASHTTPFAWCTPFLKDFSRRYSSPALPFQRLTGKTFD